MASDGHLPEKTEEVAGTVVGIGSDYPEERFRCSICKCANELMFWRNLFCRDLLYKPVVTVCGHTSCFSCVHEAMKTLGGSHCTVCKQSYKDYPNICKLLHNLLLKLEPTDYKRREKEVRAHGGRRCEKLGCQKEAEGRAIYCIAHGGFKPCQKPGCQKGAKGKTVYCKAQGARCTNGAEGVTDYCIAHGGGRRCGYLDCTKSTEGVTDYCKAHGGGRRCEFLDCTNRAAGRTDYCIAHGGGRRCTQEGCFRPARGKSGRWCIKHGGGKKCQMVNCQGSAQGCSGLCISHGGGRRCVFPDCTKSASRRTNFCKAHGGGNDLRNTYKGRKVFRNILSPNHHFFNSNDGCFSGSISMAIISCNLYNVSHFATNWNKLKDNKIKHPGEASDDNMLREKSKKISLKDVSCPICKEMLCQPAVLNCGHVYCISCLSSLNKEALRCQVCGNHCPGGFPSVCLDLDNFLKEYFPTEYEAKQEKVKGLGYHEASSSKNERLVPCIMEDKNYTHRSFGSPVSTKKSSTCQGGGGETSARFEWKPFFDEHHGDSGTTLPMKIESSSLEKNHAIYDNPSRHRKRSWWCKEESSGISDEANDFVSTSLSTYDQKGFTAGFSASPYGGITGVINKKEKITGRIGDKHEVTGNINEKHGEIIERAIDKLEIMELIMSHDPASKRYTIVCIVGADGIGKTTLASLVYCDDSMHISFEARAWLCLSDVCDYEELLISVVASLTGVSCRLNDRDELEEVLKEELIGKRLLLVLDNLCENNVEVCKKLSSLLNVADNGGAVIVTTSSNMIAGHLGTTHAYNLKALMSDSFLIMAKPNFIDYPPLESIISKIPSDCSGFPMFAKAIRGILYSAFTQKFLDGTVGSMLTEILSKPNNHLHNLLCLSYSYLVPNQKMCFLYCSLFPRDYTYNKDKLLRLWMSQGFVITHNERHGHDNLEDACDELLHRSFIDYSPSSEVEEQKYVMHEITSRLARSISGNKFFRAHGHELNCIPKDVQHLSIIPSHRDSEICFSSFTEFRELSTLLLVRNTLTDSVKSQFHVMDIKALDECLHNFRCLKTLDLSHTDIKELPESVGYISSLCFLGINNTNIRRLPDSVCNLFNLQTLELQNSAFLVELPNDIKNLSNLYHLDASKEHGPIYVPPGIGKLTRLRTLTTFTVGGVSRNCKVSELAHLNSLKGFLHIQSLNNVENAEDAKGSCLAAKKLKKLSLEWCHSGEDIERGDRISVAEHVLDALKPHNLLGELSIKGYYGLAFPGWTADHSLTDLVSITLDNCYNCEKLPPLGALPSLRFLFVQNLRGVQLINSEFCVTESINHKSFPKLEILKLRDMYNLEYWYAVLDGDFPSLRSLSIERCPKLKYIPCFQYVSDISVLSCSKLSLPGLKCLQSLKIGNLRQTKCFALPFELRSLLILEVISCEHLSSVEGLSHLQSLKHLKFRSCPRLNFIEDEPLPDTLETVDIHSNCYALSSWVPNGFEELPDASEVYRKFKRKCEAKGADDAVMHDSMSRVPRAHASQVPPLSPAPTVSSLPLPHIFVPRFLSPSRAIPFSRGGRRRIGAVELSIRAAMQAPRGGGFLGKRKEREYGYYPSFSSSEQVLRFAPQPAPPFFAKPDPRGGKPDRPAVVRLGANAKPAPLPPPPGAAKGAAGNKLLAGYLAHEFLRFGTLLGERRLEPPPTRKEKEAAAAPAASCASAAPAPGTRYAEVSRLLMAGGARIPGVVNPSQLGGWLRIKE
ncbi:hypothetical protein EJB05_20738, partial [Eragrostis curvula]